jgi:type IV pilus assembly protein PilB
VPAATARLYQCVPVDQHGSTVRVAFADPLNPARVDELAYVIKREIQPVVADPAQVLNAIDKFYGEETADVSEVLKQLGADAEIAREVAESEAEEDAARMEDMANQAPIVKFVNLVLQQAVQDRASDIHFEPFETEFKIRYRVDGALYEMAPPPKHLALPVISRIKVMSNLNISERRIPQDGRITHHVAGRTIDLRVSTLPTQFGESVVLRVLDRAAVNLELETLGFPKYLYDYISEVILRPNGIVIVTGPTGCGKTTTLYSALRRINTIDSKLLTAEDPVEYDIEGIMQVPVIEAVGMTFGKALRSFLRQDPDIIMIGEMRDLETAQIAIQSSLTGHLVMSTLHTLDATETINRIISVFPPYQQKQVRLQLSSILKAVISQRLVPRADGKGRVPALEVMIASARVKECISDKDRTKELHDSIAKGFTSYGMQTFDQSLMSHVKGGLITYDEALKHVSNRDDFALRFKGIASTSDGTWDDFEGDEAKAEKDDGGKGGAGGPDFVERF